MSHKMLRPFIDKVSVLDYFPLYIYSSSTNTLFLKIDMLLILYLANLSLAKLIKLHIIYSALTIEINCRQ